MSAIDMLFDYHTTGKIPASVFYARIRNVSINNEPIDVGEGRLDRLGIPYFSYDQEFAAAPAEGFSREFLIVPERRLEISFSLRASIIRTARGNSSSKQEAMIRLLEAAYFKDWVAETPWKPESFVQRPGYTWESNDLPRSGPYGVPPTPAPATGYFDMQAEKLRRLSDPPRSDPWLDQSINPARPIVGVSTVAPRRSPYLAARKELYRRQAEEAERTYQAASRKHPQLEDQRRPRQGAQRQRKPERSNRRR